MELFFLRIKLDEKFETTFFSEFIHCISILERGVNLKIYHHFATIVLFFGH